MKGLASAWAMARWRLKEFARFTINSTVYARFYDGDIRFSVSFDCSIPPKMATSIPNEYSKCYISTTINPRDSKFGRFKEDNEWSNILSCWPIRVTWPSRYHLVNFQCWISNSMIQPLFGVDQCTKTPTSWGENLFSYDSVMWPQRNISVSRFQRVEAPGPTTRLCCTGVTFTLAFLFTTDVKMDESAKWKNAEETAYFRIDTKQGVANASIAHSNPLLPQVFWLLARVPLFSCFPSVCL